MTDEEKGDRAQAASKRMLTALGSDCAELPVALMAVGALLGVIASHAESPTQAILAASTIATGIVDGSLLDEETT